MYMMYHYVNRLSFLVRKMSKADECLYSVDQTSLTLSLISVKGLGDLLGVNETELNLLTKILKNGKNIM